MIIFRRNIWRKEIKDVLLPMNGEPIKIKDDETKTRSNGTVPADPDNTKGRIHEKM